MSFNKQSFCILDETINSPLLCTKIRDLPSKTKFETIIKPIFDHYFGTSGDQVWEEDKTNQVYNDEDLYVEEDHKCTPENISQQFPIDWMRDQTFIFDQILHLPEGKIIALAKGMNLWENRIFVMRIIQSGIHILQFLSGEFQNDKEIVMASVRECGKSLQYASESLRNDIDIVKVAIDQDDENLQFASNELRNILKGSTSYNCQEKHTENMIDTPLKECCNDREMLLKSMQSNMSSLRFASAELRNDRDFIKRAVSINGESLDYASDDLKNDDEIVKLAVNSNSFSLQYANDRFKNRELILDLLKKGKACPIYPFLEDREIVLAAVQVSGSYFSDFVASFFKNDREIVLKSLENGTSLKVVSPEFKHDKQVVMTAVKNNGLNYPYASDALQCDREIVMEAVKQNGQVLFHAFDFINDKEIVMKAVETSRHGYDLSSSSMKHDREVILHAVKHFSSAIRWAPGKFKQDREIVITAVKNNGLALLDASIKLKTENRELAIQAVHKDGLVLQYLCYRHRNDKIIVMTAIKQNKNAFKFASLELKQDEEILSIL